PIGRLLVTDWAPTLAHGDRLLFVFDGGVLDRAWVDRIVLDQAELTGYAFHEVSSIEEATVARLARRIVQGDRARREGTVLYLEHGEPITWASAGRLVAAPSATPHPAREDPPTSRCARNARRARRTATRSTTS